MSYVQFLALLDNKLQSDSDGSKSGDVAPSLRSLGKYEAGFARLPMRLYQRVEQLHEQLFAERSASRGGREQLVAVTQQYPRQESLVGAEYQCAVPKYSANSKSVSRRDECVFSLRQAQREIGSREALLRYLERVKELLAADRTHEYDEEMALRTLQEFKYCVKPALQALEFGLVWMRGRHDELATLRGSLSDGGRSALVNSIVWTRKLSAVQLAKRSVSAGEREALHAGLLAYGKDLQRIQQAFFSDRPIGDVVHIYYTYGAWQKLKEAPQ